MRSWRSSGLFPPRWPAWRRQAESAKAETTPGDIFFGVHRELPDQAIAMTQSPLFAMKPSSAPLMMDLVPMMFGSLPTVPGSNDVVAEAYRRMADRLRSKRIDPTEQAVFNAGVPVFAVASPQAVDLGRDAGLECRAARDTIIENQDLTPIIVTPMIGADVRMIQAILGHVKLTTTEIYAHVAITKLKQVHTATHPATLLLPRGKTDGREL